MFRLKSNNQSGLASIVLVSGMVVLLSLVSIGFAKLMTRESSKSFNTAQGQAAYYAAESGLNDAISYIKTTPLATASDCSTLVGSGGALANRANLSGDGNTAYSCILIDPNPTDLQYQNVPSYKSQIVKLNVTSPISSLLISWKPTDGTKSTLVPSSQNLLDDSTWGANNYAPVMKVSFYPVVAGGALATTAANSRSFYFYPNSGASGPASVLDYQSTTNNSLMSLNCNAKTVAAGFGTASYLCNVVIGGLQAVPGMNTAGAVYYVKLTPIYGAADIQLKSTDLTGNAVKYNNVQSVVDVTAKSGSATKRLQARVETDNATVDISGADDSFPEYAIRSADTICKRLDVPAVGPTKYDANTNKVACEAGTVIVNPTPPADVTFSVDSNSFNSGSSTTLRWTPTNATSCTASGSWSGSKTASPTGSYSEGTGGLGTGTYNYYLQCFGPGGNSTNKQVTITVTSPPPLQGITITASGTNWTATVTDHGSGAGLWHCDMYNVKGGSSTRAIYLTGTGGAAANNGPMTYSDVFRTGEGYVICYTVDGASGEYSVPIPPIIINASNVGPGYYYNVNPFSGACHDGIHTYIWCFSWTATQQGGEVDYCDALGGRYYQQQNIQLPPDFQYTYGYSSTYYYDLKHADLNNWWNVMQGWSNYKDIPLAVSTRISCHSRTFGNTNDFKDFSLARFPSCTDGGQVGDWPICNAASGGGSGGIGGGGPSSPPPSPTVSINSLSAKIYHKAWGPPCGWDGYHTWMVCNSWSTSSTPANLDYNCTDSRNSGNNVSNARWGGYNGSSPPGGGITLTCSWSGGSQTASVGFSL